MATISLLRSRIAPRHPPAPQPASRQSPRPLLDRWVQPGYPHSRYY